MELATIDQQLLDYLVKLAEAKSYESRGLALMAIEHLQKRSGLAESFVKSIPVLDGSDGFMVASARAREVLQNVAQAVQEEDPN